MDNIKLILIDGNVITRESMRIALSSQFNIEVIGGGKYSDLNKFLKVLDPTLILLNLASDTGDIKPKIEHIAAMNTRVKFIVLTPEIYTAEAHKYEYNHTICFLSRAASLNELFSLIRYCSKVNRFYGVQRKIFNLETIGINNSDNLEIDAALTRREKEIIRLIADGFSTKEISEKLYISQYTVNNHRKNILHKLGTKNIAGIIHFAFASGLAEI